MIENRPVARLMAHLMLIIGIIIVAFPIYYTFVASTMTSVEIIRAPMSLLPGDHFVENYSGAMSGGLERVVGVSLERLLFNTFVVAMAIAVGKIIISFLSAFAIVFFRFPFRMGFFWMIFITLMLPVEVRILPTYKVIVDLGLLDTYAGLTLPLMASATATFLFRQFFLTIPGEMVEAARIDNAGPFRFMRDILLPLSKTNIAALFVILFIYGWTQYLWPLLVTNDAKMNTIIIGLRRLVDFTDASTPWNYVMVTAVLAIIPPVLVVVLMQRWFVKGLVETEK
ncbi:sn-glycerol-3-phosphate ABC transporter permease UgpE [Rhizobium halophilum]|uniref:sn-glycerol-3-phosphate ABC transporter permease UgpE n=1 Tax=Rhizobium halophilum TaxID=2846852 RepID=UPI001EFE8646|nr:sn-glycerol-3-phosphate ABC transporter permease UgpE [Rhizobium halophilum]MCF6370608.1 sn-glycerol-3-phosphate ABC transporter permease UgpE [Rhizobium halophilum]